MAGSAESSVDGSEPVPESDSPSNEAELGDYIELSVSGPAKSKRTEIMTRIEAIETVYELWSGENDIKTSKLYIYVLVQSILVTAYVTGVSASGIQIPGTSISVPLVIVFIPFIGIGFSWMTLVSIGRTVAFQKVWKKKRKNLVENAPEPVSTDFDFYPTKADKASMPWYGRLPAKHILLAPPILGLICWSIVLIGGLAFFALTNGII